MVLSSSLCMLLWRDKACPYSSSERDEILVFGRKFNQRCCNEAEYGMSIWRHPQCMVLVLHIYWHSGWESIQQPGLL